MPRFLRILAPAVLVVGLLVGALWALSLGGAAAERPLADPGDLVRYGLPFARTLVNVSIAGLIGALVVAVWVVKTESEEGRLALDVAAGSAAVLTVATAATLLFTYVDISGLGFSLDTSFGDGLAQFVTTIELGELWLLELLLAAATTVLCFAVRDRRLVLVVLVMALITTVPLAQQGHAAGASGHAQAVNSLLVHLVGASVWLGGLLTLVFFARKVSKARLAVLTARYSSIALIAFVAVSASGIVSAALRVGNLDDLFGTGYGQIVLLKVFALLVLGAFGVLWRRSAITRIPGANGARVFAWFVTLELAFMGLASGLAGALGRTATPVSLEPLRDTGSGVVPPAEWLTGDPLPPELTPMSYVTEWKFDLLWSLVCLFALFFYFAAVWRLRRRGDKWPVGRTVAWVLGVVILFYTTNGALAAYEAYLFSVHMLAHMLLTMMIPLALVLGAPMTLALRAIQARKDGSWGGREWIMWGIQTPFSKVVTNPAVAAVLFSGSLWVFYFSPIFRWTMESHLGHQWMIVHFLISGYLFSLSMIGIDPVPYRFPYPLRIVTLFATMASHAFFGVTMMTGDGLMLADWFGAMGREWGLTPAEDQTLGGGIAWGIGELPTLALALIVAIQWSRTDAKEQKRVDRAADRSGEAELHAYNAMLAKQSERDTARGL